MDSSTQRGAIWKFHFLILTLTFCAFGWGQTQSPLPSVSFSLDFPGSTPAHYGITISSDGHASYVSDGTTTGGASSDQPYTSDFTISQATANRVFELTKQADYFQGKLDTKKKNIASTGDKTLLYNDGQRSTVGSYNYSSSAAVQELTKIFENLSATLEFGHRLEYGYRYQKLALDQETKAMEDMANRGALIELGAIAPILHQIADDPSVVNVARARILRLLDHAGPASK